jgi:hypothetical protein
MPTRHLFAKAKTTSFPESISSSPARTRTQAIPRPVLTQGNFPATLPCSRSPVDRIRLMPRYRQILHAKQRGQEVALRIQLNRLRIANHRQ